MYSLQIFKTFSIHIVLKGPATELQIKLLFINGICVGVSTETVLYIRLLYNVVKRVLYLKLVICCWVVSYYKNYVSPPIKVLKLKKKSSFQTMCPSSGKMVIQPTIASKFVDI